MSSDKPKPLIGDLAGLGEVLNAEVTKHVYEDALSGAMREFGEGLTDTVAGLRLLTMPFILAAAWTKKLRRDCEEVLNRVPPERRTQAPPEIAGPVFQSLVYTTDDNPLKQMYLNLLERAIDIARQGDAHPAFVRIIEQLSRDEAIILTHVQAAYIAKHKCGVSESWIGPKSSYTYVDLRPVKPLLADTYLLSTYLHHLTSMGVLVEPHLGRITTWGLQVCDGINDRADFIALPLDIEDMAFGGHFMHSCVPQIEVVPLPAEFGGEFRAE